MAAQQWLVRRFLMRGWLSGAQLHHPDKTGNNPLSAMRFLKIQAAMERLTKRSSMADTQRQMACVSNPAQTHSGPTGSRPGPLEPAPKKPAHIPPKLAQTT